MSAAVFHRRRLLSDWSALRGASRLRKGEAVGRDEQDGSRGRTQLLSSAAFIISIKKGPPRQADTEVCSDEEQYSRSIRCCETFCPLFSSAILSVFFFFFKWVAFSLGLTSSRQRGCRGSFLGTVWEVTGWRDQVGFSFQADGRKQGVFVPALLWGVNKNKRRDQW